MKHLKKFKIFESQSKNSRFSEYYKMRENIPNYGSLVTEINQDPLVKEWQKGVSFNNGGDPEVFYDNKVITPYGEEIVIYLEEEMGDFDGDGHTMEATGRDKYDIEYGLTGGFVRGYFPDDPEPEYDYDGHYCWFDRKTDFPLMISDLIFKYPVVMSKIYSMLPDQLQKYVMEEIDKNYKGEERSKIDSVMKGSRLLRRNL
jgi:hypothetical protein